MRSLRTSMRSVDLPVACSGLIGEAYGAGSQCFESSLIQTGWAGPAAQTCHRTRCTAGKLEVAVLQANGDTTWLTCPSDGASVSALAPSGARTLIRTGLAPMPKTPPDPSSATV